MDGCAFIHLYFFVFPHKSKFEQQSSTLINYVFQFEIIIKQTFEQQITMLINDLCQFEIIVNFFVGFYDDGPLCLYHDGMIRVEISTDKLFCISRCWFSKCSCLVLKIVARQSFCADVREIARRYFMSPSLFWSNSTSDENDLKFQPSH